jgi:hypothetical protein
LLIERRECKNLEVFGIKAAREVKYNANKFESIKLASILGGIQNCLRESTPDNQRVINLTQKYFFN